MTSIENSELDFSELDLMDEKELDVYFNILIRIVSDFKSSLQDKNFLESLDNNTILNLRNYYDKIFELFLDWELVDYQEDISYIIVTLDNLLEK